MLTDNKRIIYYPDIRIIYYPDCSGYPDIREHPYTNAVRHSPLKHCQLLQRNHWCKFY